MSVRAFVHRTFGAFAVAAAIFFFPHLASATHSNINPTEPNHWAWSDVVGWIDFCVPNPGNTDCGLSVKVENDKIKGYASSTVGSVALDCTTAPSPPLPDCNPGPAGNWFVSNDANGNLAGWAWNDVIGWVSFCGNSASGSVPSGTSWACPASPTYQVRITMTPGPTQGDFTGWAWNDVIGWISFNCVNPGTNGCAAPGVSYKVKTGWSGAPPVPPSGFLISSTFDTCRPGTPANTSCGSSQLNTLMWRGTLNGGAVEFQIASSDAENSGGVWDYKGPTGSVDHYRPLAGVPEKITTAHHRNKRYIRYKIFLARGGGAPPNSPVVTDVILNWSP